MKNGRIYAVHSDDGIVKFGCSENVASRWVVLKSQKTIRASVFFASPKMSLVFRRAEKELLKRAKKMFSQAHGNEYFFCRHSGDARNLVMQTYRDFSEFAVRDSRYVTEFNGGGRWERKIKRPSRHIVQVLGGHTDDVEQVNLPLAALERNGDKIRITDALTGSSVFVSVKQLQTWAISQLRKELLPKTEVKEKT